MTILFLTSPPPALSPFSTSEKRPPLGVGYLMALARELGHEVVFVDCYLESNSFDAEQFCSKHKVNAVALYMNTICLDGGLELLTAIYQARQEGKWSGPIVVGGPHTSIGAEALPSFVDHIVIGEGEISLFDILEGREKNRIVIGKPWSNLDTLPFLPWDLFSTLAYDDSIPWISAGKVFTLNTSRGCPFSCTFCSVKSIWGKSYRYQSAQRILREIRYLMEKFGAESIYFREDHFTLNKPRLRQFCQGVLESDMQFTWACETRIDGLDEDSIALMAKSGCRAVYLGIESGSQKRLDRLRKGIKIIDVERVLALLKKHGIVSYCSFIAGFPGETPLDLLRTQALIRRIRPDAHAFGIFVGIPGSELYHEMLSTGSYEYLAANGLLFPKGFHVKTRYFYRKSAKELVDYDFRQVTFYDLFLFCLLAGREIARFWQRGRGLISSIIVKPKTGR